MFCQRGVCEARKTRGHTTRLWSSGQLVIGAKRSLQRPNEALDPVYFVIYMLDFYIELSLVVVRMIPVMTDRSTDRTAAVTTTDAESTEPPARTHGDGATRVVLRNRSNGIDAGHEMRPNEDES